MQGGIAGYNGLSPFQGYFGGSTVEKLQLDNASLYWGFLIVSRFLGGI